MPTRRTLLRVAASAAAVASIPVHSAIAAVEAAGSTAPEPYRHDKPMLQLQQEFLDLRFGMFLHFNMATFQDREWGDPRGPTAAFDPTALDTDQWADAALSAGMAYGCLTTKHHDGFCLWPTATGADGILKTPKKIDVVKRYVDSFRAKGLKVGLYFSILDLRGDIRHHNVTPEKIARIKAQLTELLTNYGEINVLIFDGWDAPWSRIPYSEVPFHEIYRLVKSLQPNCLISELNAASYPSSALFYSDIKAYEQNAGQALPTESHIPAQSCVTLTDGWFWKQGDEARPLKSAKDVVENWLVPQNARHCNLICNAAPGRDGKLAPNVIARLKEIGETWKDRVPAPKISASVVITTPNLAVGCPIRASASPDATGPDLLNDGDFGSSWYLPDGEKEGWIEIDLPPDTFVTLLTLAEAIGQWQDYPRSRIAKYSFELWDGDKMVMEAGGTATSPVRINQIKRTSATRVRLRIVASADTPHLSEIGVYDEPVA